MLQQRFAVYWKKFVKRRDQSTPLVGSFRSIDSSDWLVFFAFCDVIHAVCLFVLQYVVGLFIFEWFTVSPIAREVGFVVLWKWLLTFSKCAIVVIFSCDFLFSPRVIAVVFSSSRLALWQIINYLPVSVSLFLTVCLLWQLGEAGRLPFHCRHSVRVRDDPAWRREERHSPETEATIHHLQQLSTFECFHR